MDQTKQAIDRFVSEKNKTSNILVDPQYLDSLHELVLAYSGKMGQDVLSFFVCIHMYTCRCDPCRLFRFTDTRFGVFFKTCQETNSQRRRHSLVSEKNAGPCKSLPVSCPFIVQTALTIHFYGTVGKIQRHCRSITINGSVLYTDISEIEHQGFAVD